MLGILYTFYGDIRGDIGGGGYYRNVILGFLGCPVDFFEGEGIPHMYVKRIFFLPGVKWAKDRDNEGFVCSGIRRGHFEKVTVLLLSRESGSIIPTYNTLPYSLS